MDNPPYNILIIEDDKIDQLAFKRSMREYEEIFTYTIADNFENACNLIEKNEFELIISDFNLGDGTGLDVVKKFGHIPTIMVTASDDIEAAVNSLRNGARDYIVKDRMSKYLEVLPLTAKKVLDHFHAEIKAKDSEERFRELFENSSDLIQSVSIEGNFNYVNPEWKKVLKYDDDEVRNIKLLDIIFPDDRKHCEKMLTELFAGKSFKTIAFRFLSKDGEIIYVEGEVRCRFINNIPISSQAIFKNVTSKRIADEKLKNSEKQYRMLVENASDMIFKVDKDLKITFVNYVCAQETGFSNMELIGMKILSIIKKEHRENVQKDMLSIIHEEAGNKNSEYPITTKKGEIVWIGQSTTMVNDIISDNKELLVIARNITKQKLKEIELHLTNVELEKIIERRTKELKKTNKNLLEAQDELNLFLYKSSHNLMGPSSRLQGLINLQKNSDTTLDSNDFLKMFEKNTLEIREIIEKLSWVSIFQEKIEKEEVDFNELLNNCINEKIGGDIKNEIKISLDLQKECRVTSDKSLLKLITSNLLDNAVTYRKKDGRLHNINISVSVNKTYLIFEVRDTGLGIQEEIREKVFEMFYRGTEVSKGNGLGLYLVSKAVTALNGTIELISEEKEFTSITVKIPL